MANYLKPQSPLQKGEDYVYPLTTADQVIMNDGTRLNTFVGTSAEEALATANAAIPKFSGNNPITSTTDDTTGNWAVLGSSIWLYDTLGCLTDQPSQWGILINFTNGSYEVHQLWLQQATGFIYHRGGNADGWSGTWRKITDSSSYTLSGTTLTISG